MSNLLIIFAKWPKKGETKTRLAKTLGEEKAYQISKYCLDDLIKNLNSPSRNFEINFATSSPLDKSLFEKKYGFKTVIAKPKSNIKQLEISKKFSFLFSKLSKKYSKIILIPADLPFLSAKDISDSFKLLETKKFVLGPENNGGVYLIGLKGEYKKDYFKEVPWSTTQSYLTLLKNFGEKNTHSLKRMNDINHPSDLDKNTNKILKFCPKLTKVITGMKQEKRREYKVHVCAVITNGTKVLLVQRSSDRKFFPNKWGLVGGYVDSLTRKNLFSELQREIYEEIGVKITKFEYLEDHFLNNLLSVSFVTNFPPNQKIKMNNEIQNWSFFKLEDLQNLSLTPKTKERILKAFESCRS